MRFDILTLFPTMFDGPLGESIIKRAVDAGLLDIRRYNIRDYATDKHKSVDDYPYGGGAGMVMRVDVLARAVNDVVDDADVPIILMTPQGRVFNQQIAAELAQHQRIVLVCGHYEGIDERAMRLFTDQISIGDYVLTGGELAAMVIVDAVARLVPGVLAEASPEEESHSTGLLEYPQYTRPPDWEGESIPPILLSGHHAEIAKWRRKQALRRTRQLRPDMLAKATLTEADRKLLAEIERDSGEENISECLIVKLFSRQASLNIGDSLSGFLKLNGVDAKFTGGGNSLLYIVEEDHLCGLHAKPFTRKFVDVRVGLPNSNLVRVDDKIA